MKHYRITHGASIAMPCLLVALSYSAGVQAGDYYSGVPFLPTVKINPAGEGATSVETVYGKEYSHTNPQHTAVGDWRLDNIDDHDAFGVPDPLQVVSWDGQPGVNAAHGPNSGSVNAFDFSNSPGFNYPEGQIDALANRNDFLLQQVIRNEATLLFSLTGDLGDNGTPKSHVHWEAPVGPGAGSGVGEGVWAAIEAPPVDGGPGPGVNHHKVYDLDALEIWGPEPPRHEDGDSMVREGYVGGGPGVGTPTADSDRFSLDRDFQSGTSVWAYDTSTAFITPWIPHSEIVAAVEELFLTPMLGPGARFDVETRNMIDVDGTMARDTGADLPGTIDAWGTGDELLFTIDPVDTAIALDASGTPFTLTGLIDGGEVMHLSKTAFGFGPGTFTIDFLKHGGHTWDTAFPVASTFGYEFEDVDALEAVGVREGTDIATPEPGTWILCSLAIAVVGGYRVRSRA